MDANAIVNLLNLLITLAEQGNDWLSVAKEQKAKYEQILAEGRDPTPEEWDELNAKIQADTDALNKDPEIG